MKVLDYRVRQLESGNWVAEVLVSNLFIFKKWVGTCGKYMWNSGGRQYVDYVVVTDEDSARSKLSMFKDMMGI